MRHVAATLSAPPSENPSAEYSSIYSSPAMQVLVLASVAASTYHGYKRNNSVGWALWWGFAGGVFPVVTPAIALAQGFGKKA